MRTSAAAMAVALALLGALVLAAATEAHPEGKYKKHHDRDYYPDDKPYKSYQKYEEPYKYEVYEPEYEGGYKSYTKVIELVAGTPTLCPTQTASVTCGATVGITRTLTTTEGNMAATLYQTGVAVTGGTQAASRWVYQQSFRFSGPHGEGTIQTQGDDTGPIDATFTNRAIIGGTGVFTGVSGWVSRGGSPATTDPGNYKFYLTNWNGKGYGY